MIISCKSIDDFLVNLKNSVHNGVMRNVVHFNVTKTFMDHLVIVSCSATALVGSGDAWFLLSFSQDCGQDLLTANGNMEASILADGIEIKLQEACDDMGLKILPGELSFS